MPVSQLTDCPFYFDPYGCTRSLSSDAQGPPCLDNPAVTYPIKQLQRRPGP